MIAATNETFVIVYELIELDDSSNCHDTISIISLFRASLPMPGIILS